MVQRLVGSLFAVTVGWGTGFLVFATAYFWNFPRDPSGNASLSRYTFEIAVFAIYMWIFVAPVWLLAFLPLYSLIPRHSALWYWPVSTTLGALVGAVIIYGFALYEHSGDLGNVSGTRELSFIAAIVGGVTCLTASLRVRSSGGAAEHGKTRA